MTDLMNNSKPGDRIRYLFQRYMDHSITQAEEQELAGLALASENESLVQELEQEYWDLEKAGNLTPAESEKQLDRIFGSGSAKVRSIRWRRWAVAASVLLIVSLGGYFLLRDRKTPQNGIAETPVTPDVKAPGSNKAMITLANGRTVYLDSVANGTLAQQGTVQLVKLGDGQIAYTGSAKEVVYNTLTNPRGSKVIDMALADGSHMWLDAGSSVTYPVSFIGNERKVSITGEVYFEVAHDAYKPFVVSKGDVNITVLGTHFNVNAYDDEENMKVTLLEGSVKVSVAQRTSSGEKGQMLVLKPGQQAVLAHNSQLTTHDADVEQVMAWKNGVFKFKKTDLKIIMREIGRWYDVDVTYEGNIPVRLYNVGVPRTANVSEVLKGLEYTGAHFTIEEKKITVRP